MQKAAQQICEKYNGIFPNEYEQLLSLPGIGAYTAGAVASIAWNKPYAAVDGNVLRVVTRLTADSREISDTKFKNEITAALQEIYPVDKCGIFTQSLMELGAVVCMPNGTPRCTECPLQSLCSACAAGTQPAYPVKKKKAQRRIEELDRLFKRIYEDNISGKINDSRFQKLSVDYENEQTELTEKMLLWEQEIAKQQLIQEGKPEHLLEKILPGKLKALYAQSCLLNQVFVKDPAGKMTVEALLNQAGKELGDDISVASFVRYQLGA